MRDLALTLLLLAGLPVTISRPIVGAVLFAWLGLMNPHRLTWGFAESIPWSLIYAIATLAGMFYRRDHEFVAAISEYRLVIVYTAWMLVTTIFALQPGAAWGRFDAIWKVQLMCLATLMLLTNRKRIQVLAVVAAASVLFYGVKGGWFTLMSGGNHRVWGPRGSVIMDNNQLASGLVTTLPLLYWLFVVAPKRWMKAALLGCGTLVVFSILGAHSRGAFVAAGVMTVFLWLKSDRKILFAMLLPPVLMTAAIFMPENFWERMSTIATYQEDPSMQGRINTWKTAFNIANHRVTGGGLEYYAPEVFAIFAPNPNDVKSSHSIYFQALGEHGWIGLALFLGILMQFWRTAAAVRRLAERIPSARSFAVYGRMAQVSLVGFVVGGLTVNIGNWDFMFYQLVILLATKRVLLRESQKVSAGSPAPSQAITTQAHRNAPSIAVIR